MAALNDGNQSAGSELLVGTHQNSEGKKHTFDHFYNRLNTTYYTWRAYGYLPAQ